MNETTDNQQNANPSTKDLPLASAILSAVFGFMGAVSLTLLWTRVCPCPKTPLGLFLLFNWLFVGPAGTIIGIVTLKRI